MVTARKGHKLVACDLAQAESWVVAFLSGDPNMKHSLMNSDIHADTARVLFEEDLRGAVERIDWKVMPFVSMRYIGKRNNHANSYGMGPERNAQVINKDSDKPPYVTVTVAQCRLYQAKWHDHYYCVKHVYWREVEEQLGINRTIVTPYGRIRTFFGQWGKELFKEGYAFVPQSTVADHFNGKVQRELGIVGGLKMIHHDLVANGSCYIINQSHDSCMLEVPDGGVDDAIETIVKYLRRPIIIKGEECVIPVDVEVGERWGELEVRKVA